MRTPRLALAVAVIACLAFAPASASAGAPPATAAKTTCKTTYSSTSIYKRAKVVVLRGVSCKRALEIAKAFDKSSRTAKGWRCGLAHNARTRLFSCGSGQRSGSRSNAKRAFVVYGTGRRS